MALEMGDIADLYEWEGDYNTRSDVSGVKDVEETRVGTQASFEEILARELAKEQAHGGANQSGNGRRRGAASASKPRQSFLRKGTRGWWMENPEAKHKMQKYTLASVDTEANGSARPVPRAKPKAAPRSSNVRDDSFANSSGHEESPKRSAAAETKDVDFSPARRSPVQRQASDASVESVRRTLPMWASRMDRAGKGVRESVESTLGMSAVRQEYEARVEQEADELADFEALERELAAEKASYLREKQQGSRGRQYTSFSGFDDEEKGDARYAEDTQENADASWLRESEDEMGSLPDSASYHAATNRLRRSSHSSLDLGGESSMVFDGDHHHVFRSPQVPRGPRRSRPSFAPSEISAVSLNESEPWGDDDTHALDHFARLPESPIAKHGMTSVLLNPDGDAGHNLSFASNGHHESLWAGKGEDRAFEDVDHVDDSFQHFDDYDPIPLSTQRSSSLRGRDAPVSSLVQQVFGRGNQWEEEEETRSVRSPAPSTRQKTEHGNATVKTSKTKGSSAAKPSSASKKTSSRGQGAAAELKTTPRRRSPGFGVPGTLPVAIEEKLAELEEEVRFYKSETLQLQKKKTHFEDELQKLARQKDAIASFEEEQRRLIELEWEQERLKMRREERAFERQMKLKLSAAASTSSRKDRAEIDSLKAQIVKLQLDAKQASAKSKSTNDILRQRITEVEGKNRELSEEIKFLEKDRLDQWQKYEELLKELNAQKQKATSDGVKTVQDISQIGQTAEQLMSSLGFQPASASPTSPNEYLSSVASTPTYAHEDTYNPGRYRNTAFYTQAPGQSLFAGRERHSQMQAAENREAASNQDEERDATPQVANEVVHPGGKREITYQDGMKKIYFADGNEKEIQPDGHVLIRFTNGDRKEFSPSTGISVYHYFEAQTKLTTYPDKTKVYEFPNQQTEKSYPDGRTEIQFADGIKKIIHPNGDEVSTFPDGTTMLEDKDGKREVTLLNGKKVRYYPDGSMALVGVDGKESEVRSDDELKELMETL